MFKFTSILMLGLLVSPCVFSSIKLNDETAISMVPGSKLDIKNWRDYVIKTSAGTKVKIKFDRLGIMTKAEGANLNKGDIFEPGLGFISLSSAAHTLNKSGKALKGSWEFMMDPMLGWIYEILGEADGEPVDYIVDAKSSEIKNLQGPNRP